MSLTRQPEIKQKIQQSRRDAFGTLKEDTKISMCLQCHKCTAGCPMADHMDYPPSRVVRMMQLNQHERLMESKSIWLCTSCHTCDTRCPAGVNPCALQDGLRRLSTVEARTPSDPRSAIAAESFLWSVERFGRADELRMVRRFKIRTKTWFEMFFLGITMFLKGKLKLFIRKIRRPKTTREMVRRYMTPRRSKE